MKITNYIIVLYVAWCLISIMVILISLCLTSIVGFETKIVLITILIGLFFLLINIKVMEYTSSDYFIVIKKNYLLRKTGKEKWIEIPVEQLMDYSVKETFLGYQLELEIQSGKTKQKIKINCTGFTWKLMIRMIKSLENATKSNQQQPMV